MPPAGSVPPEGAEGEKKSNHQSQEVLILHLFCSLLCVGQIVASPLTIDEAVQLAIQSNPRLVAVARDIRAAQQNVASASALTNPQIFFTPSLTGGVGGGSDTEFLFAQPLELNGVRIARKKGAQARLRGSQAAAVIELQNVIFAVRVAYYELVRASAQTVLANDLLKTTQELDRIARRQVELGSRPAIEIVQTNIEVTRAKQQVTLSQASFISREAILNAVLNRPQGTVIGEVTLPDFGATVIPVSQEAVCLALENRAEARLSLASVDVAKQEARLARAEGVPDLAPQFRANSLTHGWQGGGLGIALSLPLLDYGSRRGRIRAAEETTSAEQARVASARLQIEQEVAQAVAEVEGAQAVLQSFAPTESNGQNLLADAERLLHASRVGYEEGKTSIVSLLEAQRTYRQVQSESINAQVAYALALAELSRATGAAK